MPEKSALTPELILDFLKNHPKFLKDYPQAMDYLIPPKAQKEKGIADFQAYMIDRLKADKDYIIGTAQELVETARNNMNNQQRIHNAVLRLLEAANFEEFIDIITIDLAPMLGTDLAVLVIEADGKALPHIHNAGIRLVPEGTVNLWMKDRNSLLESDIQGIEAIYGGAATLVHSQVLLRVDISMNTPPAILVFGSRDPQMFIQGQATDQIAFLARVVERAFRFWLNLP
ncbi:MAG: DUF484 family protein [Rhodospirillales bacterium]|nr:DUF484 family protein [Rhodospirillales bacterium]